MRREDLAKYFDKKVRDLLTRQYLSEGGVNGAELPEIIRSVFSATEWSTNKELVEALARPLEKIGYFYLAEEKAPGRSAVGPGGQFSFG